MLNEIKILRHIHIPNLFGLWGEKEKKIPSAALQAGYILRLYCINKLLNGIRAVILVQALFRM